MGCILNNCHEEEFEMVYQDVAHAMTKLQQYERGLRMALQSCPNGHPLELFDNKHDGFRCDKCTVTPPYAGRCRRCAVVICDKCGEKASRGLHIAETAPLKWDGLPSLKVGFDMVANSSGYLKITDEQTLMKLTRAFGFDRERLCKHLRNMDYDTNGYISFGKLALWADKHVVGLDLGLGLPTRQNWRLGLPIYWTALSGTESPSGGQSSRSLSARDRLNSFAGEPTIVQDGGLTDYPEPILVPIDDEILLQRFRKLLASTHKSDHNWTRDCQGANGTHDPRTPVPNSYELVGVARNENAALWRVYQVQREVASLSCTKSHGVWASRAQHWTPMTMEGGLDWSDHDYRNEANEWLLLHAGLPKSLEAIAQNGFTMTKRGQGGARGTRGLYGDGVYCAESITKADEYARGKVSTGPFEGCRTAAVVRVLGGRYFYTEADVTENEKSECAKRVLEQRYDSTIGDRLKLKNTFREYLFTMPQQHTWNISCTTGGLVYLQHINDMQGLVMVAHIS
jgi:hypothetical protein